ncbi:DUF6207 family protein [Streptomyces sp. NBC_01231]|nr:DUF6207 family protein [Streptomyces sp. NBC_01231]
MREPLGLAVVEIAAADDASAFAVQELLADRWAIAPADRTTPEPCHCAAASARQRLSHLAIAGGFASVTGERTRGRPFLPTSAGRCRRWWGAGRPGRARGGLRG